MSYAAVYDAATDAASTLRKQTAVALTLVARDILNEDPATPNHAARVAWARLVADSPTGPQTLAGTYIWVVLENPTIAASPGAATDGDVLYAVTTNVARFVGGG